MKRSRPGSFYVLGVQEIRERAVYLLGFCVSILLVRNSDGGPRESPRCVGVRHPQLFMREARPRANLTFGPSRLCQLPEEVQAVVRTRAPASGLLSGPGPVTHQPGP